MPPLIEYHCGCTSLPTGIPPPPHLASSSFAFHPLHGLYFCEECDAVRCNRCVTVEVSGYYCPNCLFEVPSASVRAEKNRCARNCFECPVCTNTLQVVPSDPPEPHGGAPVAISTVGEPPFFLYCNHCRWDSFDAGVTFEKPTGLALQLQKTEDSAPEILEVEKLKDYFEPALKQAQINQQYHQALAAAAAGAGVGATTTATAAGAGNVGPSSTASLNPIHAAASSALSRELPSFKYSGSSRRAGPAASLARRGPAPSLGSNVNDIDHPKKEYKPRITTGSGEGLAHDAEIEWMSKLGLPGGEGHGAGAISGISFTHTNEIASLEQRLHATQYGWTPTHSLRTVDLKPTRIPLRSKKSKRCPKCTHILIKPELKAQSTKWKIKLVAANYLPSIEVILPTLTSATPTAKRTGKEKDTTPEDAALAGAILPGKTYPFHLIFSNPLYDPINVRLSVQRSFPAAPTGSAPNTAPLDPSAVAPSRRPPYAISLPTSAFPIAAYAEAWEYEDEEEEEMLDDEELGLNLGISSRTPGKSGTGKDSRGKAKTVGILERRANVTKVGGEVVVGKEGKGAVKFNMLVSYTYRSDDPGEEKADADVSGTPASKLGSTRKEMGTSSGVGDSMKTFSFYTVVDLGTIAPKEMVAKVEKQERRESVQTVGVYN